MINDIYSKKSIEVSSNIKKYLIERSLYVKENSMLYLELNSIPMDGNGKIVSKYNAIEQDLKNIEFLSIDTIKALRQSTQKTGVLISCSHRRPGGGWLSGSMAQEENVSRCTTWAFQASCNKFKSWYFNNQWHGQNGALVIDGLLIFDENGNELDEQKKAVFAGVAAANKAALNDDNYWNSKAGYTIRKKYLVDNLSCAFEELKSRNVELIILCAFGTNVFGWKLEESIEVLHEATKNAPKGIKFVCAMGDEVKCEVAKEIYAKMK